MYVKYNIINLITAMKYFNLDIGMGIAAGAGAVVVGGKYIL